MKIKKLDEIKEEIFKVFSVPKEYFDDTFITGDEFEEWLKQQNGDSIGEIESYDK